MEYKKDDVVLFPTYENITLDFIKREAHQFSTFYEYKPISPPNIIDFSELCQTIHENLLANQYEDLDTMFFKFNQYFIYFSKQDFKNAIINFDITQHLFSLVILDPKSEEEKEEIKQADQLIITIAFDSLILLSNTFFHITSLSFNHNVPSDIIRSFRLYHNDQRIASLSFLGSLVSRIPKTEIRCLPQIIAFCQKCISNQNDDIPEAGMRIISEISRLILPDCEIVPLLMQTIQYAFRKRVDTLYQHAFLSFYYLINHCDFIPEFVEFGDLAFQLPIGTNNALYIALYSVSRLVKKIPNSGDVPIFINLHYKEISDFARNPSDPILVRCACKILSAAALRGYIQPALESGVFFGFEDIFQNSSANGKIVCIKLLSRVIEMAKTEDLNYLTTTGACSMLTRILEQDDRQDNVRYLQAISILIHGSANGKECLKDSIESLCDYEPKSDEEAIVHNEILAEFGIQ